MTEMISAATSFDKQINVQRTAV